MDVIFSNRFVTEQEEYENSPENSCDSGMFSGNKMMMMTSTSSPKKSRKGKQKRVISVPIKDVEGLKLKGEISMPPSDSWAWRKYGQKPIKGSPYPRGYYRCSSSKGCPARKQVERSRVDPKMLVVTYTCEHNHPWPASKNNNNASVPVADTKPTSHVTSPSDQPNNAMTTTIAIAKTEPTSHVTRQSEVEQLGAHNEFGWFSEFECTLLETPILTEASVSDADMLSILSRREEDDSLFADLGELPECSKVFEHSFTSWCRTIA